MRQGSLLRMVPRMRLLLIEDDAMIGESLAHLLRKQGYALDWVQNGEAGELALRNEHYQLVLLDLGLPGKSGYELLQWLRGRKDKTPVLILTARDSVENLVEGLDAGADDYLVKPFAQIEIEARIRALLRRHEGRAEPQIVVGKAVLTPATRHLAFGAEEGVLSAREYALVHALMERPGTVLSVAQLEESIYGWNEEVSSNAIEALIYQLRKKFGHEVVQNLRGVGYRIAPV